MYGSDTGAEAEVLIDADLEGGFWEDQSNYGKKLLLHAYIYATIAVNYRNSNGSTVR